MPTEPTPLASAERLIAESLAAFLPPDLENVAECAANHRWLANEGGGYVGRWDHGIVPYLVEPMESLTRLEYLTVAVVGAAQTAKSTVAENWLLYSVKNDPGSFLWYMQTDQAIEAYVKDRINPMIDAHEVMRGRQGLRPIDDSLHFKRFRGMTVQFLGAAPSTVINKTAPRIVADEYDAYTKTLGNPKQVLDYRRQTFGDESMLLALSHPDLALGPRPDDWVAGIMALYAESNRCVWYWACPHCGCFSSPAPIAARVMTLEYDPAGTLDEVARSAHLLCPVNGCVIDDAQRRRMNASGRWIGRGQEIAEDGSVTGERHAAKIAGYWILGVMSPFVLGGLGALAKNRVAAERKLELEGDDQDLRTVMAKGWGIPYQPPRRLGTIDAGMLAERALAHADLQLGVVPEWVRFLTLAVDCQIAHFEWLLRGWGPGGDSTVVDRGRVAADPATSQDDWDALFAIVLLGSWPLAGRPGHAMRPRAAGYDLSGAPGTTEQAYGAWTRHMRQIRKYGRIAGRDVFSIVPMKGASGFNAPRLSVVYPDTPRKANVKAARGTVPQLQFNPNAFKDALLGQLRIGEPGPGYVHFPAALRSPEPPHHWFEQLTAETRDLAGRWSKRHGGLRNEALDLMVMSHALAHCHGLTRIDWAKPPSWAAPQEANAMVEALGAGVAAPAAPARSAPSVPMPVPAAAAAPVSAPISAPVSGAQSSLRRSLASRLA